MKPNTKIDKLNNCIFDYEYEYADNYQYDVNPGYECIDDDDTYEYPGCECIDDDEYPDCECIDDYTCQELPYQKKSEPKPTQDSVTRSVISPILHKAILNYYLEAMKKLRTESDKLVSLQYECTKAIRRLENESHDLSLLINKSYDLLNRSNHPAAANSQLINTFDFWIGQRSNHLSMIEILEGKSNCLKDLIVEVCSMIDALHEELIVLKNLLGRPNEWLLYSNHPSQGTQSFASTIQPLFDNYHTVSEQVQLCLDIARTHSTIYLDSRKIWYDIQLF